LIGDLDMAALGTLPSQLDATLLINQRNLAQRIARILLASNNRHFHIARGNNQHNAYGAKAFSADPEFVDGIGGHLSISPARDPLPTLTDADEKEIANDFQAKLVRCRMVNHRRVRDAEIDVRDFVPAMRDEVRAWLAPICDCPDLQKSVRSSLLRQSREAEGERLSDNRCVVADAALLLEVIAAHDLRDAASLPVASRAFDSTPGTLNGLKIGSSVDFGYAAVDPDVRTAFQSATETLASLGAEIFPDCAKFAPDMLDRILKPIAYTEQAAAIANRDADIFATSDQDYREVVAKGRTYSGVDYVEATYRRNGLRSMFLDLFRDVDAIVTPTVAVTAFRAGALGLDQVADIAVDRHLGWSPFSWPINLTGLPAATIPCGFDADGLPIGLQIIAPWLEEGLILRIAAAFEWAQPWAQFRPRMS